MNRLVKWLLAALGCLSLALGIVGIAIPLLPSTPFLLLAAVLFSKSSPRFNQWLRTHKRFGPLIHDWEEHGAIRKGPKLVATCLMLSSLVYVIFFMQKPLWVKATVGVILGGAILFVCSRPHGPHQKPSITP